jgi:hypothetical protein
VNHKPPQAYTGTSAQQADSCHQRSAVSPPMRTALLLLITVAPNPVRIADPSPVHLIRRAGQLPEP